MNTTDFVTHTSMQSCSRPCAPAQLKRFAKQTRRGFAGAEIILLILAVAGVLLFTASTYQHLLTRARETDTRTLLAHLRSAGQAVRKNKPDAFDQLVNTRSALTAICADEFARRAMEPVAAELWSCIASPPRCADAWGNPIRFVAPRGHDMEAYRRVQLAGGDAIFESAGPDGDFGDNDPTCLTDNLRSDDPVVPDRDE